MFDSSISVLGAYGLSFALIWLIYAVARGRAERNARRAHAESSEAGLLEPPSLHPLIDEALCRGCGACVGACPEQPDHQVLGLIDERAVLVNPTDCIGHGACRTACPFNAITLVYGSENRGVEIPRVDARFQTNQPGIFIAGELGGMGLIRNAVIQGVRAVESIAADRAQRGGDTELDLLIVGAGPAGFAASLAAKQHGLRYQTVEQDSLGGTVFQFPRGKLVMTQPVELPLAGTMQFREVGKEKLLQFWQAVERESALRINYHERVDRIEAEEPGFRVRTSRAEYRASNVLLALGRRGTPRKLGIPGEELPKVVYRLIDPQQYRGQRVVVVGGGDSALEAACSLAEEPGTQVILSYRGEAFARAKPKNRKRVEAASTTGQLTVLMQSKLTAIDAGSVQIEHAGEIRTEPNDAVIVNAGGILPSAFLREIGVEVETKYGTA